ncbi:MAG: LOG family protein, partial [Gammaproteobacteria bacterium]
MEAACRGAKKGGGTTVGILPGQDKSVANRFLDVVVATGLGHARNFIIAVTSDALIAVGGRYGTLSEIAAGLNLGRKVVGLNTWNIPGVITFDSPADAVKSALEV